MIIHFEEKINTNVVNGEGDVCVYNMFIIEVKYYKNRSIIKWRGLCKTNRHI